MDGMKFKEFIKGRSLTKIKEDLISDGNEEIQYHLPDMSFYKNDMFKSLRTDYPVSEMPFNNGISQNISRKSEWENTDKKFIIKIKTIKHMYNIYQIMNTYFIIDLHDIYLGHINVSYKDVFYKDKKLKAMIINEGNVEIKGIYFILLYNVLDSSKNDFIFSDNSLSPKAIKFYERILQGGLITPYILHYNDVETQDKNINYFNSSEYRIGFSININESKFIIERENILYKMINDDSINIKDFTMTSERKKDYLHWLYGQWEY